MSEPFYGSVSSAPMWPGMQFPMFGLPQTAVGIGSRTMGGSSEGLGAPPMPQGSTGSMPTFGPAFPMAGTAPLGGPPLSYAFTPPPYGVGGGMVSYPQTSALAQPGPGFGAGPGAPGVFGHPGGFPSPAGYEFTGGITAPALLGAVALRRGQPLGPTNDREIEEFLYDALDLVPGANDVEVRCDGGRVTLTGTVQHKRLKRDVGEIAWAMSNVNDVVNNVTIATRRRSRASEREQEGQPAGAGKK
jgi:hypothetical protein